MTNPRHDLAILGAGAAGMIAAIAAGEAAHPKRPAIGLFEKNRRPGIKVLVCGGGRCNFTNAGSVEFLIEQFGRNGRFLTPALRHLDNDGLRAFFEARHVPSHEEHDGKIYPDSNQAKSVVDALVRNIYELGVQTFTGAAGTVTKVGRDGEGFVLEAGDGVVHYASSLLIAVGGMSYQRMGTTGDGYRFAEALGHSIVTPRPAIVGLLCEEGWLRELQGLAVQDVQVRILISGTLPKLATGKPTPSVNDVLFTHFGLSGPAVLNLSEIVAELLEKMGVVTLQLDFARGHTHEALHGLMRSWQQHEGRKQLKTMLSQHAREITITSTSPDQTGVEAGAKKSGAFSIPGRLAEKLCALEQIGAQQACAALTSAQIHRLVERIKNTRVGISGTRGFKEAMVTAGGVKLTEVDPGTMESKVVRNLFLAGEVLDLTGPSGGYNLQLAFSTGHLAGTTIGRRLAAGRSGGDSRA